MEIFIFFAMIFMHILDDFVLQGAWLSNGKQRQWWVDQVPDDMGPRGMYRNDYKVALIVHGFSWAFMIMLPISWYYGFNPPTEFYVGLIINALAHSYVDHLKANKHKTNLITDQLFHLAQIIIIYAIMFCGKI